MTVYLVRGNHAYRDHQPGERFEAVLDPDAEERAVRHGVLRILERSIPGIQEGTYTPPDGWARKE